MAAATILLAGLLIIPHGPSRPVEDPLAEVKRIERIAAEADLEGNVTVDPSYGNSTWCDYDCIQCESSGNPMALSDTGKYWGLYQYDLTSWISDGGNPDTYGSAPAAEQHAVAANATFDRWPNC